VVVFLPGDVLVELGRFLVAGVGSVFAPIAVYPSRLVFLSYAMGEVMLDARFLDISSRQIALFVYRAASAFFNWYIWAISAKDAGIT